MKPGKKELSALTNEELLQAAKKMKSTNITNALLIGFLIGVVFYSLMNNTFGFLMLIPLFLVYKLVNNSTYSNRELEKILKERSLK